MGKAKELVATITLAGKVDKSLDTAFSTVQSKVGALKKNFETKMVDKFGVETTKKLKGVAIGVAAAAAATVKAGQAAYKLGGQFDDAYDAIRVGTGATGKALQGLEGDFKAVYGAVPTSMGDAATAISDYNTRLGYTGKALQEVSKQALAVSSMTGEGLSTTIESTSKAFQAWNISAKNSGAAMDYLWKVNQATGIGFNKLAQSVTKSAPAFQQMGFSFKQSTALIGQLDKAGVDSSKVIGAMTKATTAWAKSGMTAQEGLKQTVTQIKNAKNAQEGLSIAAETFGSKAGPQMYKAIRDGTFDIQKFQKQMDASSETILKAELETARDFPEMAQIMKQNFQLALEPLGTAVFNGMSDIGPKLVTIVQKLTPLVAKAFTALVPVITTVFDTIADVIEQLGPSLIDTIMAVCNLIVAIFKALSPILPSIIKLIGSVLEVLSPIISLLAQLIQIILPPIVSILSHIISLVNGIMTVAFKIVGGILKFVVKALETIKQVVHGVWDGIKNFLSGIWDGIKNIASTAWSGIKDAIAGPMQAAKDILSNIWDGIKTIASTVWNFIKAYAVSTWNGIKFAITHPIQTARDILTQCFNFIKNTAITIWNGIKNVASIVWNAIKNAMTAPIQAARAVLSSIWAGINGTAVRIWSGMKATASAMWNAIKNAMVNPIRTAKAVLVNLVNGIKTAFVNSFNKIKGAIQGVIDKVKKLISWLGNLGKKHASPSVNLTQTGGKAKGKAKGGFTHGITIAGEDPHYPVEAVISFNPRYRKQNIKYWQRAGQMLGASRAAITQQNLPKIEPSSGMQNTDLQKSLKKANKASRSSAKSVDTSLQQSLEKSSSASISASKQVMEASISTQTLTPNQTLNNYSTTVKPSSTVNVGGVTFSPTVKVDGDGKSINADDVIKKLKDMEPEFVDFVLKAIMQREAGAYVTNDGKLY